MDFGSAYLFKTRDLPMVRCPQMSSDVHSGSVGPAWAEERKCGVKPI